MMTTSGKPAITAKKKPRKPRKPSPSVEMVLEVSIPLALYAYLDDRYVDPKLAASQLLANAVNADAKLNPFPLASQEVLA